MSCVTCHKSYVMCLVFGQSEMSFPSTSGKYHELRPLHLLSFFFYQVDWSQERIPFVDPVSSQLAEVDVYVLGEVVRPLIGIHLLRQPQHSLNFVGV